MTTREHLFSVATSLQPVVHGVSDAQLAAPTPCESFDVRALANHMLGTLEAMRRVGAAEPPDPVDPWGTAGEHMGASWRHDLGAAMSRLAEAWSRPDAWEGDALDGAMSRSTVGDLGYVEMMLHGWDLARGSGQAVEFEDDAVERAREIMDEIGEEGRARGAFGPEIEVADDASAFARVLAKAGRDPDWSAD